MKRVVLVRPEGPRNVGSVVRAAANFGPVEIVLVDPQRASILIHPDFEQMSHGVADAASRCRVEPTLAEALADVTLAVGFTSRGHQHRTVEAFPARLDELTAIGAAEQERLALVFGPERNGLSGEETALCQELVHLPTSGEHGSLNLSMAATVVLHSLFVPAREGALNTRRMPLTGRDRDFLIARATETLCAQAWTEGAAKDLAASIERVFRAAPLETRDARAWHLLLRAMGSAKEPGDFGLPGGRAGVEP
jgi:TrmH family RNA methyltransferase